MLYTIGIGRRLFPFWFKRFTVTGHKWDGDRLTLQLGDGSQLCFQGLHGRPVKVYSDLKEAVEKIQEEKAKAAQQAEFLRWQRAQQAGQHVEPEHELPPAAPVSATAPSPQPTLRQIAMQQQPAPAARPVQPQQAAAIARGEITVPYNGGDIAPRDMLAEARAIAQQRMQDMNFAADDAAEG